LIRFVAIPQPPRMPTRAVDNGGYSFARTAIDVLCDDGAPTWTGLLDPSGAPLYRVTARAPCGFGR
jgi:hypothetical protein